MSFRGGPFLIPVQSSAPGKGSDKDKLWWHSLLPHPLNHQVARFPFSPLPPSRPPLTAVVRAQQRHLEAAPPRLGWVHLHRQLWDLQLQSLAQGSRMAPVHASARAADTRSCRRGLGSQQPGPTIPCPPRLPTPHQCSMTTAGPSASFSRLSTVSAGAAFRFLPTGAMVRTSGGRDNVGMMWRHDPRETNPQPRTAVAKSKPPSKGKRGWRHPRDVKAGPSSTIRLPIRREVGAVRKTGSNHPAPPRGHSSETQKKKTHTHIWRLFRLGAFCT